MSSLLPVESMNESRRKLLLVYIHGFLGDETSFKSFPAHIHNILTVTLAKTHVVHTKIYPRYKSRKQIDFASDDFSNWLTPHERPRTDVILLGHSLGGILAAEVVLIPTHTPKSPEIHQHRVLGLVAFDVPYLGMHPGVISTGLASLFRPAPELPKPVQPTSASALTPVASTCSSVISPTDSTTSDPFNSAPVGPYFNERFENDVVWSPAKKYWESAWHFVNKHANADGIRANAMALAGASKQYVQSHLEFGGCLADYPALRTRYDHLRRLEDIEELKQRRDTAGRPYRRVRFVNYYSASTGWAKPPKEETKAAGSSEDLSSSQLQRQIMRSGPADLSSQVEGSLGGNSQDGNDLAFQVDSKLSVGTPSTGPRLSIEEHTDDGIITKPLDEIIEADPHPMSPSDDEAYDAHIASKVTTRTNTTQATDGDYSNMASLVSTQTDMTEMTENGELGPEDESTEMQLAAPHGDDSEPDDLPEIPRLPRAPTALDPSRYKAKDTLKLAEKEHKRQVKAFEQAKKDREKTIRDRDKMIQKRQKAKQKELEKQAKLEKKNADIDTKERLKRNATLNPEMYDKQLQQDKQDIGSSEQQQRKKQRDRKFCSLPKKDPKTGERDRCWVRVYMEGVDEVVAHTTLFNGVGEPYAKLVGDAASRIEEWVNEDMTKRAVLGEGVNLD